MAEHKHSMYDTDPHFEIDGVTRLIKNVSETKTMLVQFDHDSERFTFELPRHIDGHDMSLCNRVRVHYINIDKATKAENKGVYEVTDLQVFPDDEEVVVCSWLISGNSTQLAGSLHFVIEFACAEEGKIVYSWNTTKSTGISVTDGIDNSDEIAEEYADILEQWHEDLFSASAEDAVLYTEQTLTEEQKAQARANIGAAEDLDYILGTPNEDGEPCLSIANFNDSLLQDLKDAFDEMDEPEETEVDTDCFERLRQHLANPFIKTQIKLLGDSITHGMGGTGFSATGEKIPGASGYQNVLTATCWANMLYHYINNNYNKDVEVSVLDERIKYNAPSNNAFVFDKNKVNLPDVTNYVMYYRYARNAGNKAIPNAVEFAFYGDHFAMLYLEQKYGGIFEIYVDETKMAEVDAYASTSTKRKRVDVTGLSLGEHNVRIAITGRKNEASAAYQFNLEGLIIPKTAIVKPWGVSGTTSLYPLSLNTIYEETDDFVIMQFGTNDRHCFYTPDFTCENLVEATNTIKDATGAEVILMASCPASYRFEYGDDAVRYYHMWDVRNEVAQASERLGMPYVDNYSAFMRYASEHNIAIDELLADGLHPNDLGYKVMYENIMQTFGLPIVPDYTQN